MKKQKEMNKHEKQQNVVYFISSSTNIVEGTSLKQEKGNKDHKEKIIVLRPQMTKDEIDELVEKKKVDFFRHLLTKPDKSEVHVHSLVLTYEPYMIISGKYEADFYRKAVHTIKVGHEVREVVFQEGTFPTLSKSSVLEKMESKRGKNKIDLELEEHVFVEVEKEITIDQHGKEREMAYKVHSNTQENYPDKILEKSNKKDFEFTKESAIQKLKDKISGKKIDSEIRDLNENFTVNEIFQVYVPIYEARLVGPRKKVEIMRVDAVKKKVM